MARAASQQTSIAVLGAGGRGGRAIVGEASARGYRVVAIVRDPARHVDLRAPGVTLTQGDALDALSIHTGAAGAGALVAAVTPFTAPPTSFDGFDSGFYARVADALTQVSRAHHIDRIVVVSLFAALHTADGKRLADDAQFPANLRPFAHAHIAGIVRLRETASRPPAPDWLALAPSPALDPAAQATGRYRLGTETIDARLARSPLSYADLAIAVLDEIEHPTRHRTFTAVYGTR